MRWRSILGVAAVAWGAASPAQAGILFFTDRPTWEAAAGPLGFAEDFSGFAQDASFRTTPVALNGMTIQQLGTGSFRNIVDAGSVEEDFDFTEHNGTSHGSLFTNADGAGVRVQILFDLPNVAFGFESWIAHDTEGALLEVFDGASLLGSQALSNDFGGFLGYVLTGGDSATAALFRSETLIAGSVGEGFGLDNLAGTPVPEPGSAGLLGLGLAALSALRVLGRRAARSHR